MSIGSSAHVVTPTVSPDAVDDEDPAVVAGVVDGEEEVRRRPPVRWTRRSPGPGSGSTTVAAARPGRPSCRREGHRGRQAEDAVEHQTRRAARRASGVIPQVVDQLVVLLAHRAALDRAAGADRAEHRVARRVLALDELHDVDPVALQPHQRRPQRVGQGVGEPLAQDAVPGEHGVRRGGRRLADLGGDVVVAAGRGEHQLGAPADRLRERLVGRGVAGVQREHDLGRRVERDAADGADDELRLARRARRRPSCCARATAP